jgi:superoxide dismutase
MEHPMRIELPQLPYAASALEPWISARTVNTHHGRHQRAYVDKVKALVGDNAETLEAVILRTAGDAARQVLFNNAAQAWNHAFYWQCLRPKSDRRRRRTKSGRQRSRRRRSVTLAAVGPGSCAMVRSSR